MGIDAGIETGVQAGGASSPESRPGSDTPFFADLARRIKTWGRELGCAATGITDTGLEEHETRLLDWLQAGRHGEMDYMARHGRRRSRPQELVPGTLRVISVRMDYLPPDGRDPESVLDDAMLGYISRYALGRDYHKVLRARLQALAARIAAVTGPFGYRAFVENQETMAAGVIAGGSIIGIVLILLENALT